VPRLIHRVHAELHVVLGDIARNGGDVTDRDYVIPGWRRSLPPYHLVPGQVLVMVAGYTRVMTARMIPPRQAPDLLAAYRAPISAPPCQTEVRHVRRENFCASRARRDPVRQ
jgi:hypothetical protein